MWLSGPAPAQYTHGALDFTLSSEPNKQKHNMQSTLIKDANLTPFTFHLVDFAVLGVS